MRTELNRPILAKGYRCLHRRSVCPVLRSRLLSPPSRLALSVFVAMSLWGSLSGCAGFRGLGFRRGVDPIAGAPKPRWTDDPQPEDVVEHLNRNVDKLQAWRANNIRIRANNIPLSGTLAVERGRRLRLVVNSIAGNEVDIGSNDDLFWVWAKRMPPPEYVVCHHKDTEAVRQAMGIPFEPEWLMQALGVSPLNSAGMSVELEPTIRQARLVQNVTSADGHPLRKVILVDLARGLILEHSVYDDRGQRIAVARLDGHRLDESSGVIMPRRVKLDWPQNQMSLVMTLGPIEINPKGIPSQIWDMPKMQGYQVVDLGATIQPGTRLADRGTDAPIKLLTPALGQDDNVGHVKLDTVGFPEDERSQGVDEQEGTEDTELPTQDTVRDVVKPSIPKNWWNE